MKTEATPDLTQPLAPASPPLTMSETEKLRQETLAMNEALVLGAVRQHELAEAAENLNVQLQAEIVAHEQAARELAEKARLLDLTTDAIYVRDNEGRITYWNHGAEQLYGWSKEEALGKLSHLLLQTEFPMPIRLITEELHRRNHWTGELVHVKRDGRRITALVRKTLDRDAGGKPIGVLQNITDITHRKVVEDELRQARTRLLAHAKELDGVVAERTTELSATNRQLEAFVYTIAHDLRAPLRSMQGFSQLLVEEAGAALSPTARDYAQRIDKSAQFLDALLGDLLDFSRIRHQHIVTSAAELSTVVESELSRLEQDIQEKHATVGSPGPWPVVLMHEPTVAQVLYNLVGNALKFTRPGTPPVVRLWAEDHAGYVRIWVEDDGIGIASEHWAQIFRPFVRLNSDAYPGTGIGLSIVQKGVERMGGQVGVFSVSGQGSSFWFELKKG